MPREKARDFFLQRGQTLLIVVLVMVVGLTVGLSVASRTITNLRISQEEQESQKAFSAAEAGIEKVLKEGTNCPEGQTDCVLISESQIAELSTLKEVAVQSVEGSKFHINGGNEVLKNDGTDVWVAGYPDYTNPSPQPVPAFRIFWDEMPNGENVYDCAPTSGSDRKKPTAIEVIVVHGSVASPQTSRFAYDPCSDERKNNFIQPSGNAAGFQPISDPPKRYRFSTPDPTLSGGQPNPDAINVPGDWILARVVPLYGNTSMAVDTCDTEPPFACTTLPLQGKVITSLGESGGTQRRIRVVQGFPKVPSEFFQHAILSPK